MVRINNKKNYPKNNLLFLKKLLINVYVNKKYC